MKCANGDCKKDGCTTCFPKRDTARVHRFDVGELAKPTRLDNGWMEVDARLTRCGVFMYRNADGTARRELRLPEDVFDAKAMRSFRSVPVTDEHPPAFLTAENTAEFSRGNVVGDVERDDEFMRAPLMVTDGRLIKKMDADEAREVSCGYTCDLEEKGGTYKGEKYDCIQRNIRGNHVAIVPMGRAGREARVRMDSASFQVVEADSSSKKLLTSPPERTVNKITIDGIEYDAGSPAALQAQAKLDKKHDDALKASQEAAVELQKKLDAAQAKADAAEEKAAKLDSDLKALPAKVQSQLRARMSLEAQARSVLGGKAKFDNLDDAQLKVAMLKKLKPDIKLDGKAEAYIDARLDAAMEEAEEEEEEETEDGKKVDSSDVVTDDDGDEDSRSDGISTMSYKEACEDHHDSATAHAAMVVRGREMWKQPLNSHDAK